MLPFSLAQRVSLIAGFLSAAGACGGGAGHETRIVFRKSITSGDVTTNFVTDTNGLSKLLSRTKDGHTYRYVWGTGLCYELNATGSTISLAASVPPMKRWRGGETG